MAEHLDEAFIHKDDIVKRIFSGQAVLGEGEAQRLIFIRDQLTVPVRKIIKKLNCGQKQIVRF